MTENQPLIASFVRDGEYWAGAIYEMRPGLGPELVLSCSHRHPTMSRATSCATEEVRFARRVVELAEHYRGVPS